MFRATGAGGGVGSGDSTDGAGVGGAGVEGAGAGGTVVCGTGDGATGTPGTVLDGTVLAGGSETDPWSSTAVTRSPGAAAINAVVRTTASGTLAGKRRAVRWRGISKGYRQVELRTPVIPPALRR
jgi:hypothetical protein